MILFRSRRSRMVAVALTATVALFSVVATVSADSWNGERFNGEACNGYFLTRSVREYGGGFPQAFRTAISAWQGISSKVNRGMFERGSWLPNTGTDKCFVGEDNTNRLNGLTRWFKRLPNGQLEELSTQAIGASQQWYMCTLALYSNRIAEDAGGDTNRYLNLQQNAAIHEMGHSLKLAHPTVEGKTAKNQGTYRNNIFVSAIETSVMQPRQEFNFGNLPSAPQSYDEQELRARWGGVQ